MVCMERVNMEFKDLKKQYVILKEEVDKKIQEVLNSANYILGNQVAELETVLADYVGVKHCITCANGTDALQLALIAWEIGEGDAVFVPDFTFFSSGEVVSTVGATPIFVDVNKDTYNIDIESLNLAIERVLEEGKLTPRVIVAVDLFGQAAEYDLIKMLADKYMLLILEDAAQGFGGAIGSKRNGAFGDIAATSFFPAKPLGCYGDGGAIFTDNDDWMELIRSYRAHGRGKSKYDNVRIGMNSRLDTMQAAVLLGKFRPFVENELQAVNNIAKIYTEGLKQVVKTPVIREGYYSSWAQYTIQLHNAKERNGLREYLHSKHIPSMVYYQKPMHRQEAFLTYQYEDKEFGNTVCLSETVLSLPMHPYLEADEIKEVIMRIKEYVELENGRLFCT